EVHVARPGDRRHLGPGERQAGAAPIADGHGLNEAGGLAPRLSALRLSALRLSALRLSANRVPTSHPPTRPPPGRVPAARAPRRLACRTDQRRAKRQDAHAVARRSFREQHDRIASLEPFADGARRRAGALAPPPLDEDAALQPGEESDRRPALDLA